MAEGPARAACPPHASQHSDPNHLLRNCWSHSQTPCPRRSQRPQGAALHSLSLPLLQTPWPRHCHLTTGPLPTPAPGLGCQPSPFRSYRPPTSLAPSILGPSVLTQLRSRRSRASTKPPLSPHQPGLRMPRGSAQPARANPPEAPWPSRQSGLSPPAAANLSRWSPACPPSQTPGCSHARLTPGGRRRETQRTEPSREAGKLWEEGA